MNLCTLSSHRDLSISHTSPSRVHVVTYRVIEVHHPSDDRRQTLRQPGRHLVHQAQRRTQPQLVKRRQEAVTVVRQRQVVQQGWRRLQALLMGRECSVKGRQEAVTVVRQGQVVQQGWRRLQALLMGREWSVKGRQEAVTVVR